MHEILQFPHELPLVVLILKGLAPAHLMFGLTHINKRKYKPKEN